MPDDYLYLNGKNWTHVENTRGCSVVWCQITESLRLCFKFFTYWSKYMLLCWKLELHVLVLDFCPFKSKQPDSRRWRKMRKERKPSLGRRWANARDDSLRLKRVLAFCLLSPFWSHANVSSRPMFRWRKKSLISSKTVHSRNANTNQWGRSKGVYCKLWCCQRHVLADTYTIFPPVMKARRCRSGGFDVFFFRRGRREPLRHAFQEGQYF